jgi:hypothetical protein
MHTFLLKKIPLIYSYSVKFLYLFFKYENLNNKIFLINLKLNSKIYNLKKSTDLNNIEIIFEEHSVINENILPKIYNLCEGGVILNKLPGRRVVKVENASYYLGSDFIRFDNNIVLNEKLYRKEYLNLIPSDIDIIKREADHKFKLWETSKVINSEFAFFYNGTFINHWGHFILEHLSKLDLLKYLNKYNFDIFLPIELDNHIKIIIEDILVNYKNIKIQYINKFTRIFAKTLYIPFNDTFVANNSNHFSPLYTQISDTTVNYVTKIFQSYVNTNNITQKKVFIGYKGKRNLINYKEIESLFISNNYLIVYPHELSLTEKINIFSSAEYIAGIGSSSFMNTLFCLPDTKILAFLPNMRSLDCGFFKMSAKLKHKTFVFSGKDSDGSSISTSYHLDIEELINCCREYNFF